MIVPGRRGRGRLTLHPTLMDRLKSLLLPLALVFGAVAVFELGARYGASNMRAIAVSGELGLPLAIYKQGPTRIGPKDIEALAFQIDRLIATAATQRTQWFLSKNAKQQLDLALSQALEVRGDEAIRRFTRGDATQPALEDLSEKELADIRAAIQSAQTELAENAPDEAAPNTSENP